MATTTFQPYTGNGSNKDFNYSFPTFTASEVVVEVDGVVVDNFHIVSYSTTGTNTVRFDNGNGQGSNSSGTVNTNVCATDGSPKNNLEVIVRRDTNVDSAKATYTAGSSLKAADLTNNNTQILRALQEEQNTPITTPRLRDGQVTSAKIKNLTIVDEDISATAEIEVYKLKDGAANQVLVTQNDGTTVNWSSNVDLPGTLDVTGNVDFDSNLNVDGTTTLDGTTVDGTLTVTGGGIFNNIALAGNEIDTNSGNLTLDSAGGTTTVDDNLAVSGTLNVTQGITLQNATATLNGSQIVTETASQTLTNKTLTTPVINDLSGTAVVTSGTSSSDNKVYSAKRAGEIFYGKGTVEEIQSGETWAAADDKVATTAAIDARIIDLVDDVGGFVPIANETSFPDENPDINNASNKKGGTIVSIKSVGSSRTPSNGTVSIANGNVSNNQTITINGCGSTVLAAGFGVLVETTQTDHTYNFHRLVPKATEVTTVATNATQVQTVHTNISNINAVASDISNINAVAADATDIGVVAGKETEIGRLGTADAVADMAILGTTDVVADMNLLATNDVVADMNMLATSDVVADMNMLAVADVISDMDDLATSGNITAMSTCSTNIASINNCSTNISAVNTFGDQYQIDSNDPSHDGGGNALSPGDLYFNTSANELKVYNGSAWQGGVTATGNFATVTGNTFTGDNRYNDGVKAKFGTDSDFQAYHDNTNAYLMNQTGTLRIRGNDIRLQDVNGETYIKNTQNGSVEIYHDNSKKLETTATGILLEDSSSKTTAPLQIKNVNSSGVNTNPKLEFYGRTVIGQGSIPYIQSVHGTEAGGSNAANDGGLEFHTRNGGTGTDTMCMHMSHDARVGIRTITPSYALDVAGDVQIQSTHPKLFLTDTNSNPDWTVENNSGTFRIKDQTSNASRLTIDSGGQVNVTNKVFLNGGLDTDGDVQFNTGTTNSNILFDASAGALEFTDGNKAVFGTGNDLEIYHSSGVSYITDSGPVVIQGDYLSLQRPNGNKYIHCTASNKTALFFDGISKFETQNAGVNVEGQIIIDHTGGTDGKGEIAFGESGRPFIDGFDNGNHGSGAGFDFRAGNGDYFIKTRQDAAVELYYDNSKKLETKSSGIDVTGDVDATGHIEVISDSKRFMAGASNDARMYHDGTDSYFDSVTGNLYLYNHASAKSIIFGTQGANRWKIMDSGHYIPNADSTFDIGTNTVRVRNIYADTLYGDGSNLTGISSVGGSTGVDFNDDVRARFGTNVDLQIYHGSNVSHIAENGTGPLRVSTDEFQLMNSAQNETMIYAAQNGAVTLNYDNANKLSTMSSGVKLSTVTQTLLWPAFANTSASRSFGWIGEDGAYGKFELKCSNGNDETLDEVNIRAYSNGAVQLFNDNTFRFSTGVSGDYGSVVVDNGQNNWDGYSINNQYVFMSDGSTVGIYNDIDNEWMFDATQNGTSRMRWNGTSRIETTSTGVQVLCSSGATLSIGGSSGSFYRNNSCGLHPSGSAILPTDGNGAVNNGSTDLGTSSYRFQNIYTSDLDLSNEAKGPNDIDGTWGHYTIVEGESDLFLKNNRSGKKYKFNLTEVA